MFAMSLDTGLGFWRLLRLFSDLRQQIAGNDIFLPFRGLPVELLALAFRGFNAMIKT